jgi:hypothetical protein
VRFTFLGFAPKVQDVAIAPDKPSSNLGTVQFRAPPHAQLGGRRREKDAVSIEPDRNMSRQGVAPAATNASQVLEEATPPSRWTPTARWPARQRERRDPGQRSRAHLGRAARRVPQEPARRSADRVNHTQPVGQVRPEDGRHHQHR